MRRRGALLKLLVILWGLPIVKSGWSLVAGVAAVFLMIEIDKALDAEKKKRDAMTELISLAAPYDKEIDLEDRSNSCLRPPCGHNTDESKHHTVLDVFAFTVKIGLDVLSFDHNRAPAEMIANYSECGVHNQSPLYYHGVTDWNEVLTLMGFGAVGLGAMGGLPIGFQYSTAYRDTLEQHNAHKSEYTSKKKAEMQKSWRFMKRYSAAGKGPGTVAAMVGIYAWAKKDNTKRPEWICTNCMWGTYLKTQFHVYNLAAVQQARGCDIDQTIDECQNVDDEITKEQWDSFRIERGQDGWVDCFAQPENSQCSLFTPTHAMNHYEEQLGIWTFPAWPDTVLIDPQNRQPLHVSARERSEQNLPPMKHQVYIQEALPVCTRCPEWTIRNSLNAMNFHTHRCFSDCSDAFNAMGATDYRNSKSESYQDIVGSISYANGWGRGAVENKAYYMEKWIRKWTSEDAVIPMLTVGAEENSGIDLNHFVPTERKCVPCAEGKTKTAVTVSEDDFKEPYFVYEWPLGTFKGDKARAESTEPDEFPRRGKSQERRAQLLDFPVKFVCKSCPRGMVQYYCSLDEDQKCKPTEFDNFNLGYDHKNFRCAVCPVQYGVAEKIGQATRTGCTLCSQNDKPKYQALKQQSVSLPVPDNWWEYHGVQPVYLQQKANEEHQIWLPDHCEECAFGFDRNLRDIEVAFPNECRQLISAVGVSVGHGQIWNQQYSSNTSSPIYAATIEHINGCCSSCGPNKKRDAADVACVDINYWEGTDAVYGNTEARFCARGESLVYCPMYTNDGMSQACLDSVKSRRQDYWRTCETCDSTTKIETSGNIHTCVPCIGLGYKIQEADGEYRDPQDETKCTSCSSCEILKWSPRYDNINTQLTPNASDDFTFYFTEQNRYGDTYTPKQKESPDVFQYGFLSSRYNTACKPIPKRQIAHDTVSDKMIVTGLDNYKVRKTMLDVDIAEPVEGLYKQKPVPDHYTYTETDCTIQACNERCGSFEYAKWCGPKLNDEASTDVYVQRVDNNAIVLTFDAAVKENKLRSTTIDNWKIRHQGKCQKCLTCADEQYTKNCRSDSIPPEGTCENCYPNVDCNADNYLWHKQGVQACTARLTGGIRTSWPTSGYECKLCPKYMKLLRGTDTDLNLYVVSRCGQELKYNYWYWNYDKLDYDVRELTGGESAYEPHEASALPFCPPEHYYDELKDGCALAKDESAFAQSLTEQGSTILTPWLLKTCCVKCHVCPPELNIKSGDYKKCTGSEMRDTQKNNCVAKCPFGTHKNVVNNTCLPCRRCFEGESLSSL